jgi:hypothetical protein
MLRWAGSLPCCDSDTRRRDEDRERPGLTQRSFPRRRDPHVMIDIKMYDLLGRPFHTRLT